MGLNAKLFTVNGTIDGFDTIDSLMCATGDEDNFVYVATFFCKANQNIPIFHIFPCIFRPFSCARIVDSYSHVGIIACSSGSTGLPKSISISHALLSYAHTKMSRASELEAVITCFSSLYWTSGTWTLIKSAFKLTRVLTSQPFSAELFYNLVEKYKVIVDKILDIALSTRVINLVYFLLDCIVPRPTMSTTSNRKE